VRIGLFSVPRLVHGGGFEEYLIRFAGEMHSRGHDVSVVTLDAKTYRGLNIVLNLYYRNPLLHVIQRVSDQELRSRLAGSDLNEVALWRMGRALRLCDVIYAKNEVLDLGVLSVLSLRGMPPVVCGVHTPMWFPRALTRQAKLHNALYLGRLYRRLLRKVDAVHVSNEHDRELFPAAFGWSRKRLYSIPYPYDPQPVESSPATDPSAPLRVLWAARLTQQKGVDVLAQVVNRALDEDPTSHEFTIAGSGDERETAVILQLAQRSGVTYVGHLDAQQMEAAYRAADVCLVTSNWETFPYSCLEPQARGIAVVAPRIPGCTDIVEDGATGFLFEPGNADKALESLQRVAATRRDGTFGAMSARARTRVGERFDSVGIFDRLELMFQDVSEAE
jgi:glycosyltransferase involved in cell wall biosynthesis